MSKPVFKNKNSKVQPAPFLSRKKDEEEEDAIVRLEGRGWIIEAPFYWEGIHLYPGGSDGADKNTPPVDDEDDTT